MVVRCSIWGVLPLPSGYPFPRPSVAVGVGVGVPSRVSGVPCGVLFVRPFIDTLLAACALIGAFSHRFEGVCRRPHK